MKADVIYALIALAQAVRDGIITPIQSDEIKRLAQQ